MKGSHPMFTKTDIIIDILNNDIIELKTNPDKISELIREHKDHGGYVPRLDIEHIQLEID